MTRNLTIVYFFLLLMTCGCNMKPDEHPRIATLLDTDTNNELDDQHALAYMLFNPDIFDVVGVTVNATRSGGDIASQHAEARRILDLCNRPEVPLRSGANKSFTDIKDHLAEEGFDGSEAVDFIIQSAHSSRDGKLVIIAVGKLTNIALALSKDPSIAPKVRLVWLGSNYPDPGEYNLNNDIDAMNFVLNSNVQFELVLVRYGKPSGTDAVRATREEINRRMPGQGPKAEHSIEGRHGDSFNSFGDYSVNLFAHIDYNDDPPSRALFDMAAVAIVKNPSWAVPREIVAPVYVDQKWMERPENPRHVVIWEDFNSGEIIGDFFNVVEKSGDKP